MARHPGDPPMKAGDIFPTFTFASRRKSENMLQKCVANVSQIRHLRHMSWCTHGSSPGDLELPRNCRLFYGDFYSQMLNPNYTPRIYIITSHTILYYPVCSDNIYTFFVCVQRFCQSTSTALMCKSLCCCSLS